MPDEILWRPPPNVRETTNLGRFLSWLEARRGRSFDSYEALRQWSIDDLEAFWSAVAEFCDIRFDVPPDRFLSSREMPGATWLDGARLNYARHALRTSGDGIAIVAESQTRVPVTLTWDELHDQVARARAGLVRLGVGAGDRVAAYLPNVPEAIVAFLATASLGATWSSCAPEFGVRAVLDRFTQITPTVLLTVDGYRYGERDVPLAANVAEVRAGLSSIRSTVLLPYLGSGAEHDLTWSDLTAQPSHGAVEFVAVPADHPLYVLYSSGTTGMPKPIVHGHGGILIEHLKVLGLHADLRATDRFFWFTTTGWMMWNYLVSGLLHSSAVVLFDGDPGAPSLDTLWALAERTGTTWFGASAPFFLACRRADLRPGATHDLSRVRAVGSTGAPLPADGFRWVYDAVSRDVLLSSVSGGTDVCSAFVGGCPLVPVVAGEISCRYLGAAVEAFDAHGESVIGEQGELVITAPMPSMPVGFWNDPTGERYRAAYFDRFDNVWSHGDWIEITDRGSCVISGRSDATLNRGGVRIGTSEIYRVVDTVPGVVDSLVVHVEDPAGGPGRLVLFVAPAPDATLDDTVRDAIRSALRTGLSPRHVPDEIQSVSSIPTTLSGKKLELPVKKILLGASADDVASRDSLKDPAALDEIVAIARRRAPQRSS